MKSSIRRRGVALMAAIVVVVMVMGLGLAFMGEMIFRSKQELNERHNDEGLRICDAAVEQARRFLQLYKQNNTWNWNNILTYNQTFPSGDINAIKALWTQRKSQGSLSVNGMSEVVASTYYGSSEAPVPQNQTLPASPATIFGVFTDYRGGCWYMTVRDNTDEAAEGALQNPLVDTDNDLILSVAAIMRDNTSRLIEARVRFTPPNYSPQGAIISNGTIRLGGSLVVDDVGAATSADVHSNGSVVFVGSAMTVNGKVSAFGTAANPPPGIRDGAFEGVPKADMPIGDPNYYKPMASYILKSNGQVTNAAGTLLATGSFYNFDFSAGSWGVTGDSPLPPVAIYFIEGDFNMTGRGTWTATLIITGSADIRGTGAGWTFGPAAGNVAVIAGKDVKLHGNATLTGVMLANEQFNMSGNTTLNGSAIALDVGDTSQLVSTTSDFDPQLDDDFSGNARINYSGQQATFLTMALDTLQLIYTRRIK